jgi:hypothetical protein
MENKPCDHDNCEKQLIVEEKYWLYDARHCPLCNRGLGVV